MWLNAMCGTESFWFYVSLGTSKSLSNSRSLPQNSSCIVIVLSDCAEVLCDGDEVSELHLSVHGICEGQYAVGLRLDA